MSDIVTFLTAELDADERDARAAIADRSDTQRWEAHGWLESGHMEWIVRDAEEKYVDLGIAHRTVVASAMPGGPRHGGGVAAHIARHDPARVLAEVAAKREILGSYVAARAKVESRLEASDGVKPTDLIAAAELGVLKIIVRDLAATYADRPGYKAEWHIN